MRHPAGAHLASSCGQPLSIGGQRPLAAHVPAAVLPDMAKIAAAIWGENLFSGLAVRAQLQELALKLAPRRAVRWGRKRGGRGGEEEGDG